jgi:biopolymer transport protein ExbD/biopolymer transport protein TolR
MIVTVTRDGKIFLGADPITPVHLPAKIAHRLKDQSVERKVYIAADLRARWGVVKWALDGVRTAGILRVAFVAYKQQSGAFHT